MNRRKIRFEFILLAFLSLLVSLSIATKTIATDIISDDLGCTQFQDNTPNYCTDLDQKSGILIEETEETQNPDRSTTLNLKVFNTGAAAALIEVYDANERLQDIQTIEGSVPPTGLFPNGLEILDTPRLLLSDYGLFDARSRLKEQSISVTIPSGGWARITKSSTYALLYNALQLGIETLKFAQGDPDFLKNPLIQGSLKKSIIAFVKEFGKESLINIFTGTPSLESSFIVWSYIDEGKLANIVFKFFDYLRENDPSSNVFIQSFFDLGTTTINYGLEEAIIAKLNPALGELARLSRLTGDVLNLSSKAYNLYFSYVVGLSGKGTITLREAQSMATARPVDAEGRTIPTWQEFVDGGGGRYIARDYDLPDEFRNGFVYFHTGANQIRAYIFKQGLASYPIRREGLTEIDLELANQSIQSGQAISLFWNLGNSGLQFANDIEVRSRQSGAGCFRTFCLEAPFMTDSEIHRILMSGRPIGESFVLNERGRLENGDSVMSSDGSLIDRYSFAGQRGQSVKINVTSPEFDTYLLLIDPDGNKIAENDDRQQNVTNSYLEITLPKTGTYTVLVNGYDSNSRGNYLLTITSPDRSISSAGELESLSKQPETTPDRALERAIKATRLAQETIAANIEAYYTYNRVDLNGDGLNDAVAYLTGGGFCGGSGGCSIGIFQGVPGGYREVGAYSFSVTPLVVANSTTNRWQDIVIKHYAPSARQFSEHLYQFDGTGYQGGEQVNKDSLSVDRIFFDTPELERICLSGC